jgi:hypothetical protein
LARDQERVFEIRAHRGTAITGHDPPGRTRHLAAAILEHTIRDDRDFAAHMDYVHFNPVKHGLVEHPAEWPHSSFRRCVAGGLYPAGSMRSAGEPPETGERR